MNVEPYRWGGDERDRMDFTIPDPPGPPTTIPNLSDYVVTINVDASRFNSAMQRAAHHLHKLIVGFQLPAERRKHRRRCPDCNQRGYPKPLRVNGADYQRRRNNRRKRA